MEGNYPPAMRNMDGSPVLGSACWVVQGLETTVHTENKPILKDQKVGLGIMENKMETTIVYWSYIGIMEQRMETKSRV